MRQVKAIVELKDHCAFVIRAQLDPNVWIETFQAVAMSVITWLPTNQQIVELTGDENLQSMWQEDE
jgi:hypothetical protein